MLAPTFPESFKNVFRFLISVSVLVLGIGGCVGQVDRSNFLITSLPQNHVSSDPFSRVYLPGTILEKTESGYQIISDWGWISYLDGSKQVHVHEPPKPTLGDNANTSTSLIEECGKRGITGQINVTIDKSEGKLDGVKAKSACITINYGSLVTIQGRDAMVAFTELKRSDHYTKFKNTIQRRQSGDDLYLVTESYLVFDGTYRIIFDGKVTAEVKTKISEVFKPDLSGSFVFGENSVTRTALKGNPNSAFMRSFSVQKIGL